MRDMTTEDIVRFSHAYEKLVASVTECIESGCSIGVMALFLVRLSGFLLGAAYGEHIEKERLLDAQRDFFRLAFEDGLAEERGLTPPASDESHGRGHS